jgi:hypothetical protein
MNGLAVIVWTYLIGWKLIGGMLIGKVMPNHLMIAKFIGGVIGFFTGAIVSIALFHS